MTPAAKGPGAPRAGSPEGAPHSAHGHGHGPGHGHGDLAGRAWTREEAIAALESSERRRTQDPELLWDRLGLRPGTVVAEVGAGTGYFSLPAARRVGAGGRVYAVDLSPELVGLLRERAEAERLSQLVPVESALAEIPLASEIADVVLLANVLHDIPDSTLAEAVRLLKPDGRFVNLDWKKGGQPEGPPLSIRLSPDGAARRLGRYRLREVTRWEFGPWHYVLELRREPAARR